MTKNARWIRRFRRVCADCPTGPGGLWIFAGNGQTVSILQLGPHGEHVMDSSGGVDQDMVLDTVKIDNDGGDWP